MRKINKVIIHCSATPPSMPVGATEIKRWHVQDNGWKDIGYHYVIKRDGTIEQGRAIDLIGAHCSGQNSSSIGICYIGGIDKTGKPEDNRTEQQRDSLKRLVSALKVVFGALSIHGHDEFSNKACPSFNVKEETWHY